MNTYLVVEMKAVIDSREPEFWKQQFSKAFTKRGYKVDIRALEFGDVLTNNAIVERKTVFDFLNSVIDNRLDRQMNGIVLTAENEEKVPVLLLHGRYYDLQDVICNISNNPQKLLELFHGAIASVLCRYNVVVLWIENDSDAAEVLVRLVSKIDEEKYLMPRTKDRKLLLARLLGLTTRQVRELAKQCGSVYNIVNADDKVFLGVKGIGKKRLSNIKKTLFDKL